MSWSPERGLQFGVFRKRGKRKKYFRKESTHTPGNLHVIPSGVLNRLVKLTSRKPSIHYEGVEKIYPNHENALRKAGLVPPNYPTMGDLWSKKDEKVDKEKETDAKKYKNIKVYFCVAYSCYFSTSIHRVINRLKNAFNLSWTRVRMSYPRFNNLAELLNRDLANLFFKDLMDRECNCSLPSKVNGKCVYEGKCRSKCIIYKVK